jgi:hypothetical protein
MTGDARRGRSTQAMTVAMVESALQELAALVQARLPERFYRGEGLWRPAGTALVARIAGTAESIALLVGAGQQADAEVLVRALYEHVLMFCWIAIKPEDRVFSGEITPWCTESGCTTTPATSALR